VIETVFRSLLLADATVAPLVGGRVWHVNRPQDERRAGVVITLLGSTPHYTHEGAGGWTDGTVRLDVLAQSLPAVKQLATAVRGAVDGYSGTVEGVNVGLIEVESEEDIEAAPLEGRALPTFGVSIEFSFLFTQ
jgi:hypothetical protein